MMTNMLEIKGLSVGYARKGLAADDVSLVVPQGSIVALLGANGAGKTTLIRSVTGLLDLHHGHVTGGSVHFAGEPILGMPAHRLVRMGMGQVPEGRLVFKQLNVEDNLLVGAAILPRSKVREGLDAVYALFPRLLERRQSSAGWLSGTRENLCTSAGVFRMYNFLIITSDLKSHLNERRIAAETNPTKQNKNTKQNKTKNKTKTITNLRRVRCVSLPSAGRATRVCRVALRLSDCATNWTTPSSQSANEKIIIIINKTKTKTSRTFVAKNDLAKNIE